MGRYLPALAWSGLTEPRDSHKHIKMAKKKGFMTPERKKKLRTLLRKKAAEELKKEQERKAEERLRVIAERCGTKADLDNASTDELKKICQQYFDKWYSLEGEILIGETVNQPTIIIRTASLTCCTERSLYLRTSNGTIGIVRLRPTSFARDVLIDNGSGNHNKSFQNYISDNPMAYLTSSINSLPALVYISSLLDNN